jgi:hypothetical protein
MDHKLIVKPELKQSYQMLHGESITKKSLFVVVLFSVSIAGSSIDQILNKKEISIGTSANLPSSHPRQKTEGLKVLILI